MVNSMDLTTLPAKQKRLKTWSALADEVADDSLKQELLSSLEAYKATLARCWKQGAISAADQDEISDLERRISSLHELARFAGIGTVTAEHTE
ncbi:MAG: hypothetical protein K1X79_14500 [Oligoflexia bacterium]|nr:hypothetical protein [Oligoflexia bacterium]